ncbi:uncharacterized protein LOC143614947 [Bidens hawaiensis]|uniref:uncharacterized protein LOC143614947 n=1 Tax=Bidens hawaiensis TaxID=980011 RepID=UPI004049A434
MDTLMSSFAASDSEEPRGRQPCLLLSRFLLSIQKGDQRAGNIQRLENENALLIAERMRLQRLRDTNGLNAVNGSNQDINENESSSEQQQPAEAGQADSSATSGATTSQNPKN